MAGFADSSEERMLESELRWQDEILQVMYWMRGEDLGREVGRAELSRFLNLKPEQLDLALDRLAAANLITVSSPDGAKGERFELSGRGMEEGKRRFREEFSPYLARASHLTCDDPKCDCNGEDWDGACPSLVRAGAS